MSVEVWGLLSKSQDDAETIEEAITRIVGEHNADPSAHLGAGESIEVHRTQTDVDHPAGSFAVDKFSRGKFITTSFESLDGWLDYLTGTATKENQLGSLNLRTGSTNNSSARMWVVPDGFLGINMQKASMWRATLKYVSTSKITSYFGMGYMIDLADFNGFGFRWIDGVLEAWMGDDVNLATTVISGINGTLPHTYEIRYYPSPLLVEFYIDGDLVASWDTGNFPTDGDEYVNFILRNDEAVAKYMYITDFMYQQEN
jgi:hypothetical protein